MGLMKLCKCGAKIEQGTRECDRCKGIAHRLYDTQQRDKASVSIYKSNRWRSLSKIVRDNCNGLDVYQLLKYKKIILSDMVHHIVPVKDDRTLAYDMDNLIPLSNASHAEVESIYTQGSERKRTLQEELRAMLLAYREGEGKKVFK